MVSTCSAYVSSHKNECVKFQKEPTLDFKKSHFNSKKQFMIPTISLRKLLEKSTPIKNSELKTFNLD